jgi:HPr kinase/phosphorylase
MAQDQSFRTFRQLYESKARSLELRLSGGVNGLENRITSPRIQKLGLALAGYTEYIHEGRAQFIGRTEASFLDRLNPEELKTAVDILFLSRICGIVATGGYQPPEPLVQKARERAVPILITPVMSSRAIDEVMEYLDESLAPMTTVHAVLTEVFGIGVLILGKSGIGKSECALELVLRGHRLVSDDVVAIRRMGLDRLVGKGPDHARFHMELRGLGIISIKELFGISSVSVQKEIDLAIELVDWRERPTSDRLGFTERRYTLFESSVPLITLPVASGRNVATLVEVAVRIHLLKKQGYRPDAAFFEEIERRLRMGSGDGE